MMLYSGLRSVNVGKAGAVGLACVATSVFFLTARVKVHSKSTVQIRLPWLLLNTVCNTLGCMQSIGKEKRMELNKLHDDVMAAERDAFADSDAMERGKKELFELQLDGVDGDGNAFTPLGRVLFSMDVKMRLKRRLRFARHVIKERDSGKQRGSVASPIIIVGLPRTGSTMISRLLTSDPNSRSPRYWEFAHDSEDVSACSIANLDCDNRGKKVDKGFAMLSIFSPNGLSEFFKFHKVGAYEHEEIAGMSRRYFYDMETALLSPDSQRRRLEWQEREDVDRSFIATHMKAWLEMQPMPEKSFWILKSPAATSWLVEHARVFDDATFVFTSRDPTSVVPSIAGLNEVALSIKFDYSAGMRRIGTGVLGRLQGYCRAQAQFVEGEFKSRVLEVKYSDLMKDPMGEATKIYEKSGRTLEKDVEERMRGHIKGNKKGAHGKAVYSLDKFELTEGDMQGEFDLYRERFC